MRTLGYDTSIEEFRLKKFTIVINNRLRTTTTYFIHDYYPIKHFGHDVDNDIEVVRRIVFEFKDGKNSINIANLIKTNLFSRQSIYVKNIKQNGCVIK